MSALLSCNIERQGLKHALHGEKIKQGFLMKNNLMNIDMTIQDIYSVILGSNE